MIVISKVERRDVGLGKSRTGQAAEAAAGQEIQTGLSRKFVDFHGVSP
jgi:hypothetical protein